MSYPFISLIKYLYDTLCVGVPREVDEDEETIKIVQLVKSQDALGVNNSEPIVGATIKVLNPTF